MELKYELPTIARAITGIPDPVIDLIALKEEAVKLAAWADEHMPDGAVPV
jgi:hypothetical protein